MPFDSDVYRVANLLVSEYGEMARIGAILRADVLRDRGDHKGRARWLRVARAVEELISDTPQGDAIPN